MGCERTEVANLASHRIWILKLIIPGRYGNILTGIILLCLLLPLFYLGASENKAHATPVFFFSFIIAYIIPIFSYITTTSQAALLALRPQLVMDEV
jgi:hypothetical protein